MMFITGLLLASTTVSMHNFLLEQRSHIEAKAVSGACMLVTEDAQSQGYSTWVTGIMLDGSFPLSPVRVQLNDTRRVKAFDLFVLDAVYSSSQGIQPDYRRGCMSGIKATFLPASYPVYGVILQLISQMRSQASSLIDWGAADTTVSHAGNETMDSSVTEVGLFDHESVASARILMKALLVGDRSDLFDSDLYQDVKEIGLAHMVAVSGTHVGIAIMLWNLLVRRLKWSRRIRIFSSVVFVCAYVCFTGGSLSSLRSALMVSGALLAALWFRRGSGLRALSVVVLLFALVQPAALGRMSMVLSVLSTGGILLLTRQVSEWLDVIARGHLSMLVDLASVSIAAIIVTLPYQVYEFGWVSFVALLSNVVLTPLVSIAMAFGLVVLTVALFMSWLHADIVTYSCIVLLHCVAAPITMLISGIAALPFTGVHVGYPEIGAVVLFVILVAFVLFKPRPTLRRLWLGLGVSLALVSAFWFLTPWLAGWEFIMLNVGQGDACVLSNGPHALLIDTGRNDEALLAGLARHHIRELDGVLLTHADDDHVGSLDALLREQRVGQVFVARDALTCPDERYVKLRSELSGCKVLPVGLGESYQICSATMEVLSPESFRYDGGNEDSLVVILNIPLTQGGVVRILCTGDAEAPVMESLVRKESPIDILKVAHHGSAVSLSDTLIEQISPQFALISAGAHNRFGHPRSETIDCLNKHNIPFALTSINGDIVCTFGPEGFRIYAQRYNNDHG